MSCAKQGKSDVRLTDVSSQHILDLLLLEATSDDKPTRTINGTGGTQFSKQVLDDMFWLPMHPFADI